MAIKQINVTVKPLVVDGRVEANLGVLPKLDWSLDVRENGVYLDADDYTVVGSILYLHEDAAGSNINVTCWVESEDGIGGDDYDGSAYVTRSQITVFSMGILSAIENAFGIKCPEAQLVGRNQDLVEDLAARLSKYENVDSSLTNLPLSTDDTAGKTDEETPEIPTSTDNSEDIPTEEEISNLEVQQSAILDVLRELNT